MKKILIVILFAQSFLLGESLEALQNKIENILQRLPSSSRIGMLIYNPLTQDTIFQLHPEASMIPASNTKLFTTAAALTYLGGDFPLSTKILTTDKNINDGIVNGNLYIKGYGNSTFTHYDLDTMVFKIKEKRHK